MHQETGNPLAVAADTTILQSASSYIKPSAGRIDPRAEDSFEAIATAFCNGAKLYRPLPRHHRGENPFLLDLWRSEGFVTDLSNVEMSEDSFKEVGERLAVSFYRFVEGDASDVAQWLTFQFTPDNVGIYLSRADEWAIQRAAPLAEQMLRENMLPRLQDAISSQKDFRAPKEYQRLIGRSHIPSFIHLCVSYAFSIYLRGWSYAAHLSTIPDIPVYRHGWIRCAALRAEIDAPLSRIIDQDVEQWFPWGNILTAVFNASSPLIPRSTSAVSDVLSSIREQTLTQRTDLAQALESVGSAGQDSTPTDAEILILEILAKAGVVPRYVQSTRTEFLARWLQDLIGQVAPVLKTPAELVSGVVQNRWLREKELNLRLRFRRDRLWDILADPNIRQTIRSARWQHRLEIGK